MGKRQVTLDVTAARRGQRAVARAAEWLKEIGFDGFEGLKVEFSLQSWGLKVEDLRNFMFFFWGDKLFCINSEEKSSPLFEVPLLSEKNAF